MARINGSSGSVVQLEDFEPYQFNLQSFEIQRGKVFGDDAPVDQIQFIWQVGDNPADTVWTWAGLKLGKNRDSGQVARFRKILNAIAGRTEAEFISYFDDETYFWGYPDGATFNLNDGHSVIIRGRSVESNDGFRFNVEHYAPVAGAPLRVATAAQAEAHAAAGVGTASLARRPPTARPAAAVVEPSDVPF